MPTPRKYPTNAERQAAYRARRQATPASTAPSPVPGYRRWAVMRGQVHELLTVLIDEMATYWEARSDAWQESDRSERFTEQMEVLEAMRDQLDAWE